MSKLGAWVLGSFLFLTLSAADFVQTYALIEGGSAHEANPVAAEWLARHGWAGMAVFKALITATVFGAVALLARRRPPVAARVLALGCVSLLAVGVYSRGLLTAEASAEAEPDIPPGAIVEMLPPNPDWVSPMQAMPWASES